MADRTHNDVKKDVDDMIAAFIADDVEKGRIALAGLIFGTLIDLNRIANALEGINDASEWLTKPVDRADPYRQGKGGGQKSK